MISFTMNLLVLLLPITYLLHCFEEFIFPGGFINWYHSFRPFLSKQSSQYYIKVNLIGFSIILLISFSVFFFHTSYNSFLIASTFLACNAIFTHIVGAIQTHKYSPGIFTGCILYIPICVLGYFLAFHTHQIMLSDLISDLILGSLYEIWNIRKNIKKKRLNETI
ncbi:HXXEE domain-containing protein [Enterococcus sp. AZ103]|uniref:HXXEE domain-containing protein n=1 Tax=Enterococcus sp. AZ103 TaxID=2774628 RepID=UPI003F26436A